MDLQSPQGQKAITTAVTGYRSQAERDDAAFRAASTLNSNIGLWRPPLLSADAEILQDSAMVRSRARWLFRNHPNARQAVRIRRQGVIGAKLRLKLRPNYHALGISHEEAIEWAREYMYLWEEFAHGYRPLIDAGRRMTFTQFMALVHDSDYVDGEAFVAGEWRDEGAALYRTCFQCVDIDRLRNPHGAMDTQFLKGGVALDRLSAPQGYWVRNQHPRDAVRMVNDIDSTFVWRETQWGRPIGLHSFDVVRPGQTRGISEFATVIESMRMGEKLNGLVLAAASLHASIAAVLQTKDNYEAAVEALNAGLGTDQEVGETLETADYALKHLEGISQYYASAGITFDGTQIPVLPPGDELKLITPGQPAAEYGAFKTHNLRDQAAGLGVDPVGMSQDYSGVNYSSARAASSNNWRGYETARQRLIWQTAMPMVAAHMEECIADNRIAMPGKLTPADWFVYRDALVRGTFITAGKPMIDPEKERRAHETGMRLGLDTLESIAAEEGEDWEELLEQRSRETLKYKELGLDEFYEGPTAPLKEPTRMPAADPTTGGTTSS